MVQPSKDQCDVLREDTVRIFHLTLSSQSRCQHLAVRLWKTYLHGIV